MTAGDTPPHDDIAWGVDVVTAIAVAVDGTLCVDVGVARTGALATAVTEPSCVGVRVAGEARIDAPVVSSDGTKWFTVTACLN